MPGIPIVATHATQSSALIPGDSVGSAVAMAGEEEGVLGRSLHSAALGLTARWMIRVVAEETIVDPAVARPLLLGCPNTIGRTVAIVAGIGVIQGPIVTELNPPGAVCAPIGHPPVAAITTGDPRAIFSVKVGRVGTAVRGLTVAGVAGRVGFEAIGVGMAAGALVTIKVGWPGSDAVVELRLRVANAAKRSAADPVVKRISPRRVGESDWTAGDLTANEPDIGRLRVGLVAGRAGILTVGLFDRMARCADIPNARQCECARGWVVQRVTDLAVVGLLRIPAVRFHPDISPGHFATPHSDQNDCEANQDHPQAEGGQIEPSKPILEHRSLTSHGSSDRAGRRPRAGHDRCRSHAPGDSSRS